MNSVPISPSLVLRIDEFVHSGSQFLGRRDLFLQPTRRGISSLYEGLNQVRKLIDGFDAQVAWCIAKLKGHCSRDIRSGSCSGPSILRMAKHQRRLILGRGRGLFVIEVDDGGGFRPATTVEVDAALRQRELFGAAEYPLPNVRPVWVVMVPDNAQDLGPLRGIGRSVKAHTIRRHHTARPSGVTWSPCTAARLSPSLGASRFSSGLRTACTRREGASP